MPKDLADKAIEMLRNQKATNPSKPWFMWFCPGANHAPHHSPQEYVEKYKGKFDYHNLELEAKRALLKQ